MFLNTNSYNNTNIKNRLNIINKAYIKNIEQISNKSIQAIFFITLLFYLFFQSNYYLIY